MGGIIDVIIDVIVIVIELWWMRLGVGVTNPTQYPTQVYGNTLARVINSTKVDWGLFKNDVINFEGYRFMCCSC